MTLSGADLRRLRRSLLAALLLIAGGAAGAYLAFDSARVARLELGAAQKERDEINGKFRQVRNEEDEIKQKSARFNALLARGVLGDEQRLDWVELLKAISDQRRLLDLRYEFAPQRPLDATVTGAGGFAVYVSPMAIQVKLLHEEDLTRLLADLREKASALIQVKRCAVTRLPPGVDRSNAQLQADCQIDWITLRENAAAGAGQ